MTPTTYYIFAIAIYLAITALIMSIWLRSDTGKPLQLNGRDATAFEEFVLLAVTAALWPVILLGALCLFTWLTVVFVTLLVLFAFAEFRKSSVKSTKREE